MAVRKTIAVATIIALVAMTGARALASIKPATLSAARIGRNGGAIELHFDFRGTVPRWNLTAHGSELWIDLSRTSTGLPPRPLFGQETAPLKTVRVIDAGEGQTRIVIEVEGKADYAIARLRHEILLRIATAGTVPNIAAPILVRNDEVPYPAAAAPQSPRVRINAAPEPAAPAEPSSLPARVPLQSAPPRSQLAAAGSEDQHVAGRPLVMIDPGHGGYDPGTSSASGTQEKDLALAIAAKLQRALEQRGIRAEMTRSTDEFIPLPDRTKIANRASADLFVSIHLNSSPNQETTGVEVYYLNNTTDRATIRLARMENGGAPATYGTADGPNLNYILTDLRQQFKATEAASLAQMIDAQAVTDLDAGLGLNVNALGAKTGPFYVLVGAHMPAVLVETGFLSNAGEAERLSSARYQELLADGIATAVAHYFNADAAVGNL
ncbi:MAG TPA: N-acetylmuramoyl-L-alanine amidase [Candidatus Binataceae bacterium]|nr:N-acetylmuramoyl-L-alanine amidase [Candidatus Binataceae bacterium]